MDCPVCGKSAEMGARFCTACGSRISAPELYMEAAPTRFVRPRNGRMIAGVCAGIALRAGWDVAVVRLIVALLALFGCGAPVLGYFIAWVVMPNAPVMFPPGPEATGAGVS